MVRSTDVNTHTMWSKNFAVNTPSARDTMRSTHSNSFLQSLNYTPPADRIGLSMNFTPNNPTFLKQVNSQPSAGFSRRLGNTLKKEQYENTKKDPAFDSKGFFRQPQPPPTGYQAKKLLWQYKEPERVKIEDAGKSEVPMDRRVHETFTGVFLGGKRLCPENPTMLSNVDVTVFNHDIDQSDEVANFLDCPMFVGAAGFSKWAGMPATGYKPPGNTFTHGPETKLQC